MNTVSISFSKSKVFNAYDAVAVRCGYMLGDAVLLAGDMHMGVFAEHYFGQHHDSTKNKIKYLIHHIEAHPEGNVPVEEMKEVLATWQMMESRKHRTPQQIIAAKKMEKAIEKMYGEAVQPAITAFETAGMSQLAPLIDDGIALGVIDDENREMTEAKKIAEGRIKLSTVLLDFFGEKNPNDIYLVSHDFDEFIKTQKLVRGWFVNEINPAAQIISAPLFKLPTVSQLKATELQSIRKSVHAVNESFRKNMYEWSGALKLTAFEPLSFATLHQFYASKIAPCLPAVQQAFDDNEILKQSHASNNYVFDLSINLHACPLSLYHVYLTSINSLGTDTLQVMNAVTDFKEKTGNVCLLLQCSIINIELKKKAEENTDEPELTKRKTLDID